VLCFIELRSPWGTRVSQIRHEQDLNFPKFCSAQFPFCSTDPANCSILLVLFCLHINLKFWDAIFKLLCYISIHYSKNSICVERNPFDAVDSSNNLFQILVEWVTISAWPFSVSQHHLLYSSQRILTNSIHCSSISHLSDLLWQPFS